MNFAIIPLREFRIKNSIPNEGENIDSVRCSCFIAGIRWGTDGTKELNFVGYIVY